MLRAFIEQQLTLELQMETFLHTMMNFCSLCHFLFSSSRFPPFQFPTRFIF